jgi:putative transposase/transposase-like zinc-binding protein
LSWASDVAGVRIEVADIFRRHGEAWRTANADHINLAQRRVMTAIEICRTAVLGGHVERCQDCLHLRVFYNSCRNRHCGKCLGKAAADWLKARQAELLAVPHYHFVFKLPGAIAAMSYQNKSTIYALLFKAAAQTLTTIGADPKHLGAEIGVIAVLHTWGQNLQHHPHLLCIVPGGGISADGKRWVACRPGFCLPVRILSSLFRRLFLEGLMAAFAAGELKFFGELALLDDTKAFAAALVPLRTCEWFVYAKKTFPGPERLLAYLARYTHRVAITNSRLVALDDTQVSFRCKAYRKSGRRKSRVMHLEIGEFMRRFLLHVLPNGFHRVRHYGFLANGHRAQKLAVCRSLLSIPANTNGDDGDDRPESSYTPPPCPCCGGRMAVTETLYSRLFQPHPVRRPDGL